MQNAEKVINGEKCFFLFSLRHQSRHPDILKSPLNSARLKSKFKTLTTTHVKGRTNLTIFGYLKLNPSLFSVQQTMDQN